MIPALIVWNGATKLLMTDVAIDAHEALALGLVDEVVADARLEESVRELARRLAAGALSAFANTKALMSVAVFTPLETQLARGQEAIVAPAGTPDFLERLRAFINR